MQPKAVKKPKFQNELSLYLGILLILLMGIGLGFASYRLNSSMRNALNKAVELEDQRSKASSLEMETSLAARMAAVSGGPEWIQRYHEKLAELKPNLDSLLSLPENGYSEAEKERILLAFQTVRRIEGLALEQLKNGNQSKAIASLEKIEYLSGRGTFNDFFTDLSQRITGQVARHQKIAELEIWKISLADFAMLFVLLGVWVFTHKKSQAWKAFMENFNTQLESEVKLRTLSLQQAKEDEAKANQAKSDFLSTMSHEIRTPLNGILGLTHIMLEQPLKSKLKECASGIKDSAENLLVIINDILDQSKIESGKMEIESLHFSLATVVSGTLSGFKLSSRNKKVTLELDSTLSNDAEYWGDPGRIRQVLTNLLGNALKFTHEGVVRVVVREENLGDESQIRFEVIDTGIGIPKEIQSRLFEAFSQANTSTSRRYGGSGLGLSISKRIVQLLGGQIGLISEEGKGSTFWFEIPLKKATALPVPAEKKVTKMRKPLKKNYRVLVVEDNQINLKITSHYLQSLGYFFEGAGSGAEALDALRAREFDVVLMDCQMPEMDGYEATRIIRKGKGSLPADIPIVALTSNASSQDKDKCFAAGMNGHIGKPFAKDELDIGLRDILECETPDYVHLDLEYVAQLSDFDKPGQVPFICDVGSMFLERFPARLKELKRAFACGEMEKIRSEAHQLVSSSGNLGGRRLSKLFRELEETSPETFHKTAKDLIASIETEYETFRSLLEKEMKRAA